MKMNALRLGLAALGAIAALSFAVPSAKAESCERIKAKFFSSVKPAMRRAVISSPTVAIGFNRHLSVVQRRSDPTIREINQAYRLLLKDCKTRSDRSSCNRTAKKLQVAAIGMFRQHQKWARAKCRGRLAVK